MIRPLPSPSCVLFHAALYLLSRHHWPLRNYFQGNQPWPTPNHSAEKLISPNCRRSGGNPGSRTVSSMITTTSISMSTSALTLSTGTTCTEPPGRKERSTERTSSGEKGKISPRPQGENIAKLMRKYLILVLVRRLRLMLAKEKMRTPWLTITIKINTCDR